MFPSLYEEIPEYLGWFKRFIELLFLNSNNDLISISSINEIEKKNYEDLKKNQEALKITENAIKKTNKYILENQKKIQSKIDSEVLCNGFKVICRSITNLYKTSKFIQENQISNEDIFDLVDFNVQNNEDINKFFKCLIEEKSPDGIYWKQKWNEKFKEFYNECKIDFYGKKLNYFLIFINQ